ncbi:MAG TPA: magnesium transporter [Candidatus Parcubacteria bacterium]|nr:magnesium transporter [Candidatus Parcubacteria bacterium]
MNNEIQRKLIFSRNKIAIFRKIPVSQQGFILLGLSNYIRKKIIRSLKNEEIINLLRYLDPGEATNLLRNLKPRLRKKIIEEMKKDIKEKVEFLLKFNPRTAAGLMNLNYIEVEKDSTFGQVAEVIRKYEKRTRKFPEILVVENGFLVGELEGYSLFFHKPEEKIENYIRRVPTIKYDKNEKEIISLFKKNPRSQIVVLDKNKSILGVIYSADILRLINEQSVQDLSSFAGVKREEDVYDSVFLKVKNRYKWLIINLGTAFLAASVVGLFQGTISKYVLLAVYMPIVAGMGGNAATQTLAVVVRGLALKEVDLKSAKRVIINEVGAGAVNGIINGAIVALVAAFFNQSPLLGLVVAVAMVFNLVIAGFFGTLVPLIMKRLGKDPASSATIFITTATDVCGFFSFLGLASLVF